MADSKLIRNLVIGAGAVVLVIGVVASYIGAANYGNDLETQLDAKYQNNEVILSSGYQQLQGVAGVTKMATDDQIAIFTAAIQGRYGANGSQAVFQMLKEQNPQIDHQLYRKVQQIVESTQKEFQNGQTEFLEMKRSYTRALGTVWQGFWLARAGYPKVDLNKYKIISSDSAADAFKTGKQKKLDFGR